ncbi:MAG TPA: MFS transporter, partial [Spirochaetia bacterium]|nr:MFS transporter [Spirochaetia bacterium]
LFASYAILTPYLQLFLKARGLSLPQIGFLLGLLELAGIGGPIILGHLADKRAAYRFVLFAGLVISVLVFIPLQLTTALPVFLVCIAVMGFFYRAGISLLDSLVGRILPDPARQYGGLRVAGSISFTVVSLVLQLTGAISGDSSLSILASFSIATGLTALAVWLIPAAPAGQAHAAAAAGKGRDGSGLDARFWTVIGIIFLGRFGLGAYYSFFSLYLKDSFGLSGVGFLWAIGSLAEIPMVFFSGSLIRKLGIRVLLTLSLLAVSLRLGMFILAPSLVVVALAQLLHAFTFGTFHTASVAYVNSHVAPARRGVGMAIYNAVGGGLPTFLAASLGGLFLESHGYRSLFLAYALVPLAGVAILVFLGKRVLPVSDSQYASARLRDSS